MLKTDLVGKTFGYLTVCSELPSIIKYSNNKKHTRRYGWIYCDRCKNWKVMRLDQVQSSDCKSCGCLMESNTFKRKISYIGQKFGKITVCTELPRIDENALFWCYCECGNWITKTTEQIANNKKSLNCGCINYKLKNYMSDFIGRKFNRLTICSELFSNKNGGKHRKVWVRCDCGEWKNLAFYKVRLGLTQSCGCLNTENTKRNKKSIICKNTRGGKYWTWAWHIKKRDGFQCQICGVKNTKLTSHHIMPWKLYPELRLDLDNGICLCTSCHNEYHSIYGKDTKCNNETFNQFTLERKTLEQVESINGSLMFDYLLK